MAPGERLAVRRAELSEIMPPPWLDARYRRRWHELFIGRPVDQELAAAIYREIVAHYAAAIEAQGDAELFDEEGRPSPPFQMMREASAAMFQLRQALGFPPWQLAAARTSPRRHEI